jgi:release factor glutamine methyltransferase
MSRETRDAAIARLRAAGIEDAAREARWLAAHATDEAGFAALIARRAAREPLAYLLGTAYFRGLELAVSPATLIPRADSETLIEAALQARPDRELVHRVLDLGTGTGCLLLAALTEYAGAWGVGVDLVPCACRLAAKNAVRTGLAGRCAIICADWAAPIAGSFDLILANPPYIEQALIASLMPEVAQHEPASALDGGPDGLDAYRVLLGSIGPLLAPGGIAIFELGAGQATSAGSLARGNGWAVSFRKDPAGHARALILSRPSGLGLAKKSFGVTRRPG